MQALEVHFQPLDAQNEAKKAFVWAKEAGATLPVRKCAASSAGGFLSGAGAVQQAQEAHIHLLHARPRANQAICWMPEAQRHAQEAQRQRAEANRLAAIERKRAREAVAQRTVGEPQPT